MSIGGFGPRFAPSTARRFVVLEDDRTEVIPDRLMRDRADTVRITMPAKPQFLQLVFGMPALMKLMIAGIMIGSIVAIFFAYRTPIG